MARQPSQSLSPRQVQEAYTDLAATAQALLAIDPNMPAEQQKLWTDMLEAESQGDPFRTLDQMVHAAVQCEHFAAAVRDYRRDLEERQDRLHKSGAKLRDTIKRFMSLLQLETLTRPTYSVSIGAGRVHVVPTVDALEMPPRFQRIHVETNKEALAEALKAGETDVPAHWSNSEPVLTIRVR